MNYEFITKLYYLCCTEFPDDANQTYFSSLYNRISDTSEADTKFNMALERCRLTRDELLTLDELEGDAICAYELQGFINGFRIGASLGAELGTITGAELPRIAEN